MKYVHWHEGLDPERGVSVDGDAPGTEHLSHWPGNRTIKKYRHDTSTGIALRWAKDPIHILLDPERRFDYVTNNHYDTDGVCSAFTVLYRQFALEHGPLLTAAAAAGDFSRFTTPEGVKIDLTLTALTRAEGSPLRTSNFPDEYSARQAQYDHALNLLPRLFVNPDLHADWFATEYWTIQRDMRRLREDEADIETFPALDLAVVVGDRPFHETAVNTATACDRILAVLTGEAGNLYDLRLTTLSWFQLKSRAYRPRPDWQKLAAELNEMAPGEGSWQADDVSDPTPHLWFGGADGQPALNTTPPQIVKSLAARFFTQDPHLPAGI